MYFVFNVTFVALQIHVH